MQRATCEECNGKIEKKKVDYYFIGEHIGKFPAEVCAKCGEEVFDEEVSDQIEAIVKKKGLYGLAARTKISQTGTSLDVKINKKLAEFMNLKKGERVTIYPENKRKLIISL